MSITANNKSYSNLQEYKNSVSAEKKKNPSEFAKKYGGKQPTVQNSKKK